jgi:competence protein ComFC
MGRTHRSCVHKYGLDGIRVYWKYAGTMRKLILKFKYNFSFDMANFLAYVLDKQIEGEREFFKDAIFLPVPLYVKRERWRGFNQASEVVKKLCIKNNWKFSDEILVRKKATKTQAQLKGEERKKNVKDVFGVNYDMISRDGSDIFYCSSNRPDKNRAYYENASLIASKSEKIGLSTTSNRKLIKLNKIIIFDDVWTSGSTMRECCKVLKKAGAKSVWGMTIAG